MIMKIKFEYFVAYAVWTRVRERREIMKYSAETSTIQYTLTKHWAMRRRKKRKKGKKRHRHREKERERENI